MEIRIDRGDQSQHPTMSKEPAHLKFPPAPKHVHPPLGDVHVWRVDLIGTTPQSALRQVLGRYIAEKPDEIRLARGERGKPRLAVEPERLAFNLSHSGDLALVAVASGREVGVDVERIDPARDFAALAERAFGPEDASAVRSASDRPQIFYELWTRHEARLKCLGVGLAGARLTAETEVDVEKLQVDRGYAAALAFNGSAPRIHCWTLPFQTGSG